VVSIDNYANGKMKNYIIAGNHAQYKDWLRTKILTPSAHVYVSEPTILAGIRNPHGWFIGTWYKRPNQELECIFDVLLYSSDTWESIKILLKLRNDWRESRYE
jgi:hypothetical protein